MNKSKIFKNEFLEWMRSRFDLEVCPAARRISSHKLWWRILRPDLLKHGEPGSCIFEFEFISSPLHSFELFISVSHCNCVCCIILFSGLRFLTPVKRTSITSDLSSTEICFVLWNALRHSYKVSSVFLPGRSG